jgi:hypothetical protein
MAEPKSKERYSDEVAEQRLQAALRGARVTGHKQMVDVQKKRMPKRAKKKPGK